MLTLAALSSGLFASQDNSFNFQSLHHATADERNVYSIVTAPKLWQRPGGNVSLVVWHTNPELAFTGLSGEVKAPAERRWNEALLTMGSDMPQILHEVPRFWKSPAAISNPRSLT